jgi:hypothetical protein
MARVSVAYGMYWIYWTNKAIDPEKTLRLSSLEDHFRSVGYELFSCESRLGA